MPVHFRALEPTLATIAPVHRETAERTSRMRGWTGNAARAGHAGRRGLIALLSIPSKAASEAVEAQSMDAPVEQAAVVAIAAEGHVVAHVTESQLPTA